MAKWIVDDPGGYLSPLEKLDDRTQREICRKMVENGAKVLIKEMQDSIESRHHVISRGMKDSVAAGKVYQDIDGTSIEVWPQGEDARGVSNEMKLKMINYGYYNKITEQRVRKKDFFLGEKFRKKCEPRIRSVMNYTFQLCMDELNNK